MTKEEFEQLKSTVKQWLFHTGALDPTNYANELKLKFIEPREKQIKELEAQIDEMKKELHHRLVSPSESDSDCLDKIIGLDLLLTEPDDNNFKWKTLKVGDIIYNKDKVRTSMVIEIDYTDSNNMHIFAGDEWLLDKDLVNWEKLNNSN